MRTQFTCVLTLIALLVPTCVFAAKPRSKQAENATTVEMFEAIEKKQVEVQYIPKDATQANVLIKNKTDKPLKIQLPAAFAGVPVLAQFGGGGMGMGGMGGGMGGMDMEALMKQMGGMGGMGGDMGGMGGLDGLGDDADDDDDDPAEGDDDDLPPLESDDLEPVD